MATDKTYSVVGTTIQPDGQMKIRWTNNIFRIKILQREGHTDIQLVDLGKQMTKYEAVKAMQSLDQFSKAQYQSVIAEYLEDKAPKAVKAAPAPAVTATADTETV
jgi:hypothetical protein